MKPGLEHARGPTAGGTDVSVSLRTLLLIRLVAVIVLAVTVLVVHLGFGFNFSTEGALTAVAISAALNIVATLSHRAGARLGNREALMYLAYDTLQLSVLLFLTGGLQNPFAILMLAPVTVSATILSRSSVIGLSALTVAALSFLALFHLPLPARPGVSLEPRSL
jgi:two-component system sensor histidine kinase RegB